MVIMTTYTILQFFGKLNFIIFFSNSRVLGKNEQNRELVNLFYMRYNFVEQIYLYNFVL